MSNKTSYILMGIKKIINFLILL